MSSVEQKADVQVVAVSLSTKRAMRMRLPRGAEVSKNTTRNGSQGTNNPAKDRGITFSLREASPKSYEYLARVAAQPARLIIF